MEDADYEPELTTAASVSSDEEEIERKMIADRVDDDVIDKELEMFLGDMENELDQLILESKTNPAVPKMLFAEWYENHTSRKKSYPKSEGWELYTSPEGYPYYYNSVTDVSEWAPYEEKSSNGSDEGLLSTLQNLSPSSSKQPVSSVTDTPTPEVASKRSSGILDNLDDVSPSPMKRPVTTVTHITPGGEKPTSKLRCRQSELLEGLESVSPSPAKRPVTTVTHITPGYGDGRSVGDREDGGGLLRDIEQVIVTPGMDRSPLDTVKTVPEGPTRSSLLEVAKKSLFSFGSGWDRDRKSQGRFTLEQIAKDAQEEEEEDGRSRETTKEEKKPSSAAAAVSMASAYSLSFYTAAASTATAYLSAQRAGGDEDGGEAEALPDKAQREALRRRLYEQIKGLPGSVEISVAARSETKIPFIVPKGKELVWKMQVKDYDLGFAVRLRQQGEGGSRESDLLPMEKISCEEVVSEGCCAERVTRSFIFVFDNTYSKLRSKTCVYNIRVVDTREEEANGESEESGMAMLVATDSATAATAEAERGADSGEEDSGEARGVKGGEDLAAQSGESDDDSSCSYASAEEEEQNKEGRHSSGNGSGGGGRVSSSGDSGGEDGRRERRRRSGGAISVRGGVSVNLVPLAASSRAVGAASSPDHEEDLQDDDIFTSSAVSSNL